MKAYKPLIVRTYVAPKLYPSGYIILALVITQLYLEFSTQPLALSLKSTIERFAGQGFVNAAFKFLVGAHGAEAFWTLSQCIRYHCDFVTGFKYVCTTLVFGFLSIQTFNKQVRKAEKEQDKTL